MTIDDWRVHPQVMRARRSGDAGEEAAPRTRKGFRKESLIEPFAVWPLLDRLDKLPLIHRRVIIAMMVMILGAIDYLTGYEASVASLYVMPVFLAGWTLGLGEGLVFSLIASTTLILTNWLAGQHYSAAWIPVWNILVRGATFAVLVVLANALRGQMERVHRMSLADTLTCAWNRRALYQIFAVELARVARNPAPISLVYIDVDDFKKINDGYGHSTGDEVLKAIASSCTNALRLQDTVARLGGDEFAILMPETDDIALDALLVRLKDRIREETRAIVPITVSMGGVTFMGPPGSVNEALHLADELMYRVKSAGKDHVLTDKYAHS